MAITKIGTTGISNNLDVPGYLYLSGDNKELRFYNGANYMVLKASGSLSNNYTITLPVDDGTTGQVLITDGGGVTSWSTVTSSDTTYTTSWVDSSANAILRLTAGGSGSGNDDLTIVAGSNITLTPSGDNLTIAAAAGGASLSGSTNNTVVTVTGADAMIGEANLTFDGTSLGIGASTSPSNVLHLFKADGSDVGITFSSIGVMTFAMGIDDTDNVFKINGSSIADQSAFGIDQHKTVGINMLTGTPSWGIGGEGGYPLIIKGRNDNNLALLCDSPDADAGSKINSFERGSGGSSGAHSYVSQSAVNIMKAGGAGSRGALLLVHGEQDGDTSTFFDMVVCPVTGGFSNNGYSSPSNTDNGTGNVIFRMNVRGSPSARTYSLGATNTIYLAMASGNYNIVTTMIGLQGLAT